MPYSSAVSAQVSWMPRMISCSRSCVCSKLHESREAFCCISSAEVATPPAFAALPGANSTSDSWKRRTASVVQGMFAPSATATTPFSSRVLAWRPLSSFWVAHGRATDPGTSHTEPPAT